MEEKAAAANVQVAKTEKKVSAFQAFREKIEQEKVLGYLFIAPALAVIVLLVAYPFVIAIMLSLHNSWVGARESQFVGLANFVAIIKNSIFQRTVRNTFLFTGASVGMKIVLGLCLAMLMHRTLRFRKLFRAAVLLPWVVPTALSVLAWWWMLDPQYSVVNWTLEHIGLKRQPWLSNPDLAMLSVIIVNTWRGLPFFAIAILAGLVSIPQELYEAADTDGAGRLSKFWHITLPLLKPVLAIVILFSTIFTFADFNIVYVLTRGGPMNTTHLFATLSFAIGLGGGNLGQGAAISLFLFPLLVAVVFIQLRVIRREEII